MKKRNPARDPAPRNTRDRLKNAFASADAEQQNENRNHNTKKTALGPNTKK